MVLECECGYVARGDDENRFVECVRAHAREAHGVELTDEVIVELAQRA